MSETINMDGFEVVQERGTTWEPKTRKDADGEQQKLKATDKSWVAGYYIGSDDNVGNNGSTVHKFKLLRQPDGTPLVGDASHFQGDPSETGDIIAIWGTGVLNGRIAEFVAPGQAVRIAWLGRKKPVKNPTGKPYHVWEVAVNRNIPMLDLSGASNSNFDEFEDGGDIVKKPQPAVAANDSFDDDFDDDDLM